MNELKVLLVGIEQPPVEYNIRYNISRASNGETAAFLQVTILGCKETGWKSEKYSVLEGEKGIARIKQLFGTFNRYVVKHTATGDTELAVTRTRAEAKAFAEMDAKRIYETNQEPEGVDFYDMLANYTVEGRNVA